MKNNSTAQEIVDYILGLIETLPNPPRESIKKEFLMMKEMLMNSRAPKLLLIGRRGSGKSSLINAIFGEILAEVGDVQSQTALGGWYTYKSKINNSEMEVMDSRGLGDSTIPEGANSATSLESMKIEIDQKCPDVLMFLCKAIDVDSRINEDINEVIEIQKYINSKYNYECPIIGLVTQVDQLAPSSNSIPPFSNKKQENISKAVSSFENALIKKNLEMIKIIPISAYLEFENGNISYDTRWNIDLLLSYLLDVLPESAQFELARLSKLKSIQIKLANKVIGITATACGLIGATPIPFADLPVITAAQIGMIVTIGFISGEDLDTKGVRKFLAAVGVNVGAAFVIREAARALLRIFVGPGDVASGAIAAAATWGLGKAAIAYFIEGKSAEEANNIYKGSNGGDNGSGEAPLPVD